MAQFLQEFIERLRIEGKPIIERVDETGRTWRSVGNPETALRAAPGAGIVNQPNQSERTDE